MKKLITLALSCVVSMMAFAVSITPGQGYKLRLVSHASHSSRPASGEDVYFNMESQTNETACFSTTPSIIYFDKVASDGRFVIHTGAESAEGARTYGVNGNGWTPVTNNSSKTSWYVETGDAEPKTSGNQVIFLARTYSNDAYSNYAGLNDDSTVIWNDKGSNVRCEWELVPVGTPRNVTITEGKAYFIKKKDSDLYLDLNTFGTVGGNANETTNASLQSQECPIYFTKVGDYGFNLRAGQTSGNYLKASSWNAVLANDAFAWGMVFWGEDEDENPIIGLYNNNSDQFGYANANASAGAGVKVYSNNDPSSHWILIPATATPKEITVKFVDDSGNTVEQRTVTMIDGNTYTLTVSVAFYEGSKEYTFNENNIETVEVPVTLNLPFLYTSSTDNLIWQAVQQHSNQDKHKWSYDATKAYVPTTDINYNNKTGFSDNELWAFVGNITDGFKIYNKAAGTDKCLNFQGGDGYAVVSAATTNNVWTIEKTLAGSVSTNVCGFSIPTKSGNYLNWQVNQVKWYNVADQGSSCSFYSPSSCLIAYANDLNPADTYELHSLLAAATAAPYDYDKMVALRNGIAAYEEQIAQEALNNIKAKGDAMATLSIVDSSAWTALAEDATRDAVTAAYNTMAKSATGTITIAKHTINASNTKVTDYLSAYQGHPHRWNGNTFAHVWEAIPAENGGFYLFNVFLKSYISQPASGNLAFVVDQADATPYMLDTYDSSITEPTFAFKSLAATATAGSEYMHFAANHPSAGAAAASDGMELAEFKLPQLTDGKYYRIHGIGKAANFDYTGHYIEEQEDHSIAYSSLENVDNTQSVWQYDEEKNILINAKSGRVLGKCTSANNTKTYIYGDANIGKTELLNGSVANSFLIRTDVGDEHVGTGRYLGNGSETFSTGDPGNANNLQNLNNVGYSWQFTEVTWYPIPVENTKGYTATFYCTEELMPYTARIHAYEVSQEGDHVVKTLIEGNIPANTPVLIEFQGSGYSNGATHLQISSTKTVKPTKTSVLTGTILAEEIENAMTYQNGSFVPTTEVPGFSGYLVGEEALPLTNPVHDTAETISFTQGSKVVSINHDGVLAANDCHPHAIHIVGMARTDYQFNHNSNELKLADGNATLDLSNLENGTYTMTIEPGFFTVDGTHISKGATAEITVSDSGVTGLEELSTINSQLSTVYDLQGRRLSAPAKGINIINGKKILKK